MTAAQADTFAAVRAQVKLMVRMYLSATDLANAWAYAQAYPDEIELAIQRNQAA